MSDILHFPAAGKRRTSSPASAVAHAIADIVHAIARLTDELEANDLPAETKAPLVLQAHRIAMEACAMNLCLVDHVKERETFSLQMQTLLAGTQPVAEKPGGPT